MMSELPNDRIGWLVTLTKNHRNFIHPRRMTSTSIEENIEHIEGGDGDI